jgi:hypothetical protein
MSVVKTGSFDQWLRKNDKLGGQNKIPRLSNNRVVLEQILQIAEEEIPS